MPLDFLKWLVYIYWDDHDDHMAFIFQFIDVVNHVSWFANSKPFLNTSSEFHMVRMNDQRKYCWILFSSIMLRIFVFMLIGDIGQSLYFFVAYLYGFSIKVMLAS